MINEAQQLILFWVFIGFFLVIGIIALLAIVGLIKTDKQFLKWAVGGFVTGVAGVVFVWAKYQPPLDIFVNLKPPKGIGAEEFILTSGIYQYWDRSKSDRSTPSSGSVELTAGHQIGLWTARFPYKGMSKSVTLKLKDDKERWWQVRPFYPNYNLKELRKAKAPPQNASAMIINPLFVNEAYAADPKIEFNNYAKETRKLYGKTYYRWRVFVDEPENVLKTIEEIEYLLHPTFSEPLQIRDNRGDKFAIEATGWGEFIIQISIKFINQTTSETSYYLDFSKSWP